MQKRESKDSLFALCKVLSLSLLYASCGKRKQKQGTNGQHSPRAYGKDRNALRLRKHRAEHAQIPLGQKQRDTGLCGLA